jgi:hypothetical protein
VELLKKLTPLIPPPRQHLLRFHGVFALNSKLRSLVVPKPPVPAVEGGTLSFLIWSDPSSSPKRRGDRVIGGPVARDVEGRDEVGRFEDESLGYPRVASGRAA